MTGVGRLRALGVHVLLKFVLMKSNAHEAEEMIRGAEEGGFPHAVDPALTARYDGTRGSLDGRLDEVRLEALYRGPLADRVRKGNPDPTDDEFRCNCARGNAAVSATGEVWPCIAAPLRAGNVREEPFGRIWADSPVFRRLRTLRVADFPTCAPCGLKAWCRRSPGTALANTGTYTAADPWTCREAEILQRLHNANPVV
jgi:radical SAM protein with 4Fe4S-binding SPASM domain